MELEIAAAPCKRGPVCFRSSRILRQHVLAQLREDVAQLHADGRSPAAIGRKLGIALRDVHAFLPAGRAPGGHSGLGERALLALIRGRYAEAGGRTLPARMNNLARIAACYSREELLAEPGVGVVTALQIELWLEKQGGELRQR